MKACLRIVLIIVALYLASCTYRSCPTYSRLDQGYETDVVPARAKPLLGA